ncbi:hypothetical protein COLO4_19552 [Corchorus olitorius]|uniref:Uncharacterized protein n=1 Tax=Corchorus olitorius TaxID=93759 RepID=A0A1R3J4U5_9ROSI|nr:hypothetical protein COLO4_19552 [Corchorus olitorius]
MFAQIYVFLDFCLSHLRSHPVTQPSVSLPVKFRRQRMPHAPLPSSDRFFVLPRAVV